MRTELTAPFKEQLLAQRASLLEQLANLRGGTVGRAEASAERKTPPPRSVPSASLNSHSLRGKPTHCAWWTPRGGGWKPAPMANASTADGSRGHTETASQPDSLALRQPLRPLVLLAVFFAGALDLTTLLAAFLVALMASLANPAAMFLVASRAVFLLASFMALAAIC